MKSLIIAIFILASIFAFIQCPVEENIPLSSEKELLLFVIPNKASSVITDAEGNVTVTIYESVDVTKLVPVIRVSPNAVVSPASGTIVDFTDPVLYKITAQDGSSITFTVTVKISLSDEKELLSFSIPNKESSVMTDTEGNITVKVYELADITRLVPVVRVSPNAIVSPSSGTTVDFTNPVQYTITAQDGSSKNVTVTVEIVLSGDKDLLSFVIPNKESSAMTDVEGNVTVKVYELVDIARLVPVVRVSPNAVVSPASGTTIDFTNPVQYTITAQDGSSTEFTVTIEIVLSNEKKLLSFTIPNNTSDITIDDIGNVTVGVYEFVDITRLIPVVVVSPNAAVSPASGAIVDFTDPVLYTITAHDGSEITFTVTVSKELSRRNEIISFTLVGTEQIFEREGDYLYIYVPYETDVTNIKANIVVSNRATVSPGSGAFVNFTSPQIYTVTASDGTVKNYLVTVKRSPWRKVGNGPFSARDDIALIELNGKLFMLRGWIGTFVYPVYSREIWATEDGETWTKILNEVPWQESVEFKNYISFVKFNNLIWAFGAGRDGDEIWNTLDGVNWIFVNNTSIISAWGRRYWPYVGEFKNKIYVIGGLNWWDETGNYIRNGVGSGVFNDIWSSDDGINWMQEKSFSQLSPRGLVAGFATLNDILYIVSGGINIGNISLEYNDVWASSNGKDWYSYNTNTPWGKTAYNSIAVHNGKLFVATGTLNGENTSNQIWTSSDGRTWYQIKHCFFPKRHATGLVSFKGKLWLIAGFELNDIWCYDPDL